MTNLLPKQASFLAFYKDPKSETFGNMLQSALKAGYPLITARQLSSQKPNWLYDNAVVDVKRIQRAEANLDAYNSYELPLDSVKTKRDIELIKLQADVSKFILKTQARAKYGEDKEVPAPNVQINIVNYSNDKTKEATYTDSPTDTYIV